MFGPAFHLSLRLGRSLFTRITRKLDACLSAVGFSKADRKDIMRDWGVDAPKPDRSKALLAKGLGRVPPLDL